MRREDHDVRQKQASIQYVKRPEHRSIAFFTGLRRRCFAHRSRGSTASE